MTESAGNERMGAMSISDAAERTGLSTHTLRYHEREGLMFTPVDRASSTDSRYTEAAPNRMTLLTKLRTTSMPIAKMRPYVELARRGGDCTAERLGLPLIHRMNVERQLKESTASLAAIDYKIGLYQEGVSA
ncbi:MerR family transcriptional regulator [Streptomyces sp. NPDC053427]|uniref:MerR family transcriptional regulator n=1 Tax=Streptomyces sp. NPDC053427 TaxID=3365701 RepID=UPI0037D7A03E